MIGSFFSMSLSLIFFLSPHHLTPITSQTGTLIVLNKSDHTAMLIDRATGEVKATIPTGQAPHEVAVSPDGKWAVVSNYGGRESGSSLTVIHIESGKKLKDIQLGEYHRPHGLAWLSRGSRVLVTAEAKKSLLVVDVDSSKVVKAIRTDQEVSHMVVATPDDALAFVANIGSGSVSVIDLEKASLIKTIKSYAGTEGIAVSPDGKELWVTNRSANNVSIIDTKKLEVVDTLRSESFPIRIKFTPEGKYALVSNARSGNVTVFDVKARKEVTKISFEVEAVSEAQQRLFGDRFGKSPVPIGIVVPPDGTLAYVANSNADVVAVIDLKEWKVTGWIKAGREPDGLGFSPLSVQGSGERK